ncbi:MAG TPA: hypothetical protein VGJ94_09650 [Syntrophorhabdaceae bacterium]|jgi:hypothetical protein
MIKLATEINSLWEPVFPYLARHIGEVYGRRDGVVLDVGPFAGAMFELRRKGVGEAFIIASFPYGMAEAYKEEIEARGHAGKVGVIDTEPGLACVRDNSIDLLVFRGALFFPALFRTDLSVMFRVLRRGGIAFVGGGFGKYTPPAVIEAIGERSRDLNLKLGKTGVSVEDVWNSAKGGLAEGHMEIISEGGLWVVIRR